LDFNFLMKVVIKIILYLAVLIAPFLVMLVANEHQRGKIRGKVYEKQGIEAINSVEKTLDCCTWYCHNDTEYCIKTHNRFIKGTYLTFTNRIYFGILDFLSSVKGAYVAMNILFLVVVIPLLIWILLICVIENILTLRKLKK
jgi:hypothetical protein